MKTTSFLFAALCALLAGCSSIPKLVVALPDESGSARPHTFKNTRGHRYTEMFLIGGNAITKDLTAGRPPEIPVLRRC